MPKHIFTSENNMLSSHVKRALLLWLHDQAHLMLKWFGISLVFI